MIGSERHYPYNYNTVAQADAMMDYGSSPANVGGVPCWRSNEASGEQRFACKPTRRAREQPLSAATHAQASPECHRQAGGQPSHTSSNTPTKRITRSHTKLQREKGVKKMRFKLENNQIFEYRYGQEPIKGD